MFHCQSCNKLSQPGEKPRKIVTEVRERVYTRKKGDREITIGRGSEIVTEKVVCAPCAGEPNEQAVA